MTLCKPNKSINAYDDDEEEKEEEAPDNYSLNTRIGSNNGSNHLLNAEYAQFSVQPRPRSRSQFHSETNPTISSFQLALPPPKFHRPGVLRISSLLILQIQQLSLLARRPVPVLEIRRPSMLAPVKLSREFSRRMRLTSKDYYITQIEPFMSIPCSASGKSDSPRRGSLSETEGEDGDENGRRRRRRQGSTSTRNTNTNNQQQQQQYHPIIAAIKSSRKEDRYHQGKMYLRNGRIWKATTLSNDICRFAIADETGSNIIVQLEKLSQKQQQQQNIYQRQSSQTSSSQPLASPVSLSRKGTDESEPRVTFGIWIINQETKRSVLVGFISRYYIELYLDRALRNVYDEFWVCLVPPVLLDPGEEDCCCQRDGDEDWESRLYTLIGTFGVWMAFREGWAV